VKEGNLCSELVRERRFCTGSVIKTSPSNVDRPPTIDGFSSSYPAGSFLITVMKFRKKRKKRRARRLVWKLAGRTESVGHYDLKIHGTYFYPRIARPVLFPPLHNDCRM